MPQENIRSIIGKCIKAEKIFLIEKFNLKKIVIEIDERKSLTFATFVQSPVLRCVDL